MNPQQPQLHRRGVTVALSVTVGWLATQILSPAIAAEMMFGNQGVRFDRDTTLQSDFIESHGAYQSTFGVINRTTNEKTPLLTETKPSDNPDSIFRPSSKIDDLGSELDFPGTPGNAVPQPSASFKFQPNNEYVFYLESTFNGRPTGILYSTDSLNPNQEQQVQFRGSVTDLCSTGGMTIGWDDTGSRIVRNRESQDRDFDDFIVRMRDTTCPVGGIPEPVTSPTAQVPPQPVGALPTTAAGGTGALFPLLGAAAVGGAIAAFSGDDDGGSSGGGGGGGEVIPEPMTIMGSSAAIGVAALLKRRQAKKNKKNEKK